MQTAKKEVPIADLQQLVVESLPTVGPVHAKALLSHFGSVSKIFNAKIDELTQAEGIGKARSQKMRQVIDAEYGAQLEKTQEECRATV
jgi:ERCC4-type nuclease